MQNKLENDLRKLAQDILLLKDFKDIDDLREKAQKIYEQLVILSFQNNNPKTTPIKEDTPFLDSEISKKASKSFEPNIELNTIDEKVEENIGEDIEKNDMAFFKPKFDSVKEDLSQKQEFKDTISLNETEKLFKTKKTDSKKKIQHKKESDHRQLSLHDKLLSNSIQIGLNDRIAFVNNLFNFSQTEFNKTLSILNECKSKHEAISYIHETVKIKYNWQGKEDLEERLLVIIERKFL